MFGRNKKVKICFDKSNSDISGVALERLWAIPDGQGVYTIKNSPFNVYGISYNDKIKAIKQGQELFYKEVVNRGGHSTFRVRLNENDSSKVFVENRNELVNLGCTFERCDGDPKILYVIDVPPGVNLKLIEDILKLKEESGIWEYEEVYIFEGN